MIFAANMLAELQLSGQVPDLDHPDWSGVRKTHDWRNHIPEPIRLRWYLLTPESRAVAFVMAANLADDEEWD